MSARHGKTPPGTRHVADNPGDWLCWIVGFTAVVVLVRYGRDLWAIWDAAGAWLLP